MLVRYAFKAPRFARRDSDKRLVLSNSATFPVLLGRRYLTLGQRRTPLFIDSSESSHTVVTMKLPPGWALQQPLKEAKSQSPWGSFVRREHQEGDVLTLEEDYRLQMARVAPKDYDDFAHFAGDIDLIQGRDLLVEKK